MSQAIDLGGRAAISGIGANLGNVQPFARSEHSNWVASVNNAKTSQHHDPKVISRICEYNGIPYVTDIKLINTGTGTDKGPALGGTDDIILQVAFSEKVTITGTIATNSVPRIVLALTTGGGTLSANVTVEGIGAAKASNIVNFIYPTAAADTLLPAAGGLHFPANAIVQTGGSTIKGPTGLPAGLDFANVVFTSMSIN